MNPSFPKPRVVFSRCFGFEACRHNGQIIQDDFVRLLLPHVEPLTVCPEVEIGLGTPRGPILIESAKGKERLVQPSTGRDLTQTMKKFAADYLEKLPLVDGFVLKGRSPSCAFKDAKRYPPGAPQAAVGRGPGFFAAAVLEKFGHLALEDEGRLKDLRIREHFLTRLYVMARFRELLENPTPHGLVRFHARHKLLLLAYNQKEMRLLGPVVAAAGKAGLQKSLANYGEGLGRAFARMASHRSHLNVLEHAAGYFSRRLTTGEKRHFTATMQKYAAGRVPLAVPAGIVSHWIARFGSAYLEEQFYFSPYPEELVPVATRVN